MLDDVSTLPRSTSYAGHQAARFLTGIGQEFQRVILCPLSRAREKRVETAQSRQPATADRRFCPNRKRPCPTYRTAPRSPRLGRQPRSEMKRLIRLLLLTAFFLRAPFILVAALDPPTAGSEPSRKANLDELGDKAEKGAAAWNCFAFAYHQGEYHEKVQSHDHDY
jgi:hypothetical protein